jgi:glutamine synthetase
VQASGGKNADFSQLAYQFTAGLLRHAPALAAVTCPTVNSYKRLVSRGYMDEISWAPVYQAYGHNNRTLMCRLPMTRRCVENRAVDSACNFYLGAAFGVAAGLEGIRLGLDPGDPVDDDSYKLDDDASRARGIDLLPGTLRDAIEAFEKDSLAVKVFGEQFHADYVKLKKEEWRRYHLVVSDWERKEYLRRW